MGNSWGRHPSDARHEYIRGTSGYDVCQGPQQVTAGMSSRLSDPPPQYQLVLVPQWVPVPPREATDRNVRRRLNGHRSYIDEVSPISTGNLLAPIFPTHGKPPAPDHLVSPDHEQGLGNGASVPPTRLSERDIPRCAHGSRYGGSGNEDEGKHPQIYGPWAPSSQRRVEADAARAPHPSAPSEHQHSGPAHDQHLTIDDSKRSGGESNGPREPAH